MNITLDNLKGYRRGNELVCLCPNPAHRDTSPSFNLNMETGLYYCFGCGLKGRLNLEMGRAALIDRSKFEKKKVEFDDTKFKYHKYVASRGVDKEMAKKFGVGYSASRRAVVFPCHNMTGQVVGNIGRIIESDKYRYLYSTGFDRSSYLYNVGVVGEAREVILVEGVFDCLRLFSLGIKNVLAILGTWMSAGQIMILSILGVEKIFLCLDSDETGQQRSKQIGLTLVNNGFKVKLCSLGERGDPAEVESREEFAGIIGNAKSYYDFISERGCRETRFAFESRQ